MDKKKKWILITISLFIISIVYIFLLKTIDIKPIGPKNSEIGFSTINRVFHDFTGNNTICYGISKYLGYLAFVIVIYYIILGFLQLKTRKSITKVDNRIIKLGVFYILVGLVYILFEKVIINYRPVILDGELEASFPSSHTMLAICICLSSILISKYYIKGPNLCKKINIATIILMLVILLSRTLSGVHWITDIIGGIIISLCLVSCYYTMILFDEKNTNQKR